MRIRSIKPEWLEDERLALASPIARVMSIALITLADDEGRGRGNPVTLGGRVFPGSENPREDSATALGELARLRYIVLYEVDGQAYFQIRNWTKHQRVDKPTPSRLPAPPADDCRENTIVPTTLTILAKVREDSRGVANDSGTFAPDLGPRTVDQDQDQDRKSAGALSSESGTPTPDPVQEVFNTWLEEHVSPDQRAKCKLNAKRRALIRARLREYPLPRLQDALRGAKRSAWHMGQNPEGRRYTGLQTLLRDGEQVEKFEALLSAPVRPATQPGVMRPPSPDHEFQPDGDSDEYIDSLFAVKGAAHA